MDILVHAPPRSSAGLIRLLKSLEAADYFGEPPSLVVELPAEADPLLLDFLSHFSWPPSSGRRDFTLRRRLESQRPTPQEASLRAVDSVYPKDSQFSDVLVLSAQAKLAPSYYHYLKYTLLAFKYPNVPKDTSQRLAGISLELPLSQPTDSELFSKPSNAQMPPGVGNIPGFLWQVPNSNAALYFGDKWMEFRSFLSNRFLSPSNFQKHPNVISTRFTAWMEYMLELMRARGYYVAFPAFGPGEDLSLASVHEEQSHPLEEIASPLPVPTSTPIVDRVWQYSAKEGVLTDALTISNILVAFPGGLPALSSLPVLNYLGEQVSPRKLIEQAETYSDTFRIEIGGCDRRHKPVDVTPLQADDLFCFPVAADRTN